MKSVSFSPDGRYIVSGSYDRTIRIWDVSTGVEVRPALEEHTASVTSVSFSPDGRYIVSGSFDKIIRRWDFPPLQELIDQTRERFKDRQLTPEERKMFYLD
ncbi:MAG: PD40 domain-containing protein [Bacteroidales bacterium]|nr:PD40 domain-containing protein [Bacteroidales bacterium]